MSSVLVTLADKNFIDQAKQLFSSAYHKGLWRDDFLLLAYEIAEEDLVWFREKKIQVKHCKNFLTVPGSIYSSPVGFAKFHLFTEECKKWDSILYLDADIIVRKPLDELRNKKGFFATIDSNQAPLEHQFTFPFFEPETWNEEKQKIYDELRDHIDLKVPSFNTGMFLFSTNIIQDDTFHTLENLVTKFHLISKYAEQAVLNLYFYKKWQQLEYTYNFLVSPAFSIQETPENSSQVVLHFFAFAIKPWRKESPFYAEWKANLLQADDIRK